MNSSKGYTKQKNTTQNTYGIFSLRVKLWTKQRDARLRSLDKERRVSAQNVAGARRVSIGSIIPRASLGSPGSRNLTEHEQ